MISFQHYGIISILVQPVNRNDIKGDFMDDLLTVREIAEKVAENGGRVYLVGGCVRDEILGKENKDIDIEIHGISVNDVENILDTVGKRLEYGKSFGVYGLSGCTLDISLPRKNDGIDPFLGTESAARRRDFTINALMKDALTGEVSDYFGGLDDLKNGIIRHVDDETFPEDSLRVFRAAQFASRLGFSIAPETEKICRSIDVSSLPAERVMTEIEKALLKSEKPSVFFELLRGMDQLDVWFPEVKALIGVPQNQEYHKEGDAWTHTMMVMDEAAKRRSKAVYPLGFMMSALCHDLGKAVCTTEDQNGVVHSYLHETEGLPVVREFLRRLTSESRLKKYVMNMVEYHMEPNAMAHVRSKLKKTNKLFDSSVEPFDLIQLSICDGLGKIPSYNDTEEFLIERYNRFTDIMSRPYVMGSDLIDNGLVPDEGFSDILAYAHKLRLAGIEKDDALKQTLAFARKIKK